MNILVVLIAASILVAGAFLAAFIISARSGQFDDTYSPGRRILFDDAAPRKDSPALDKGGVSEDGIAGK